MIINLFITVHIYTNMRLYIKYIYKYIRLFIFVLFCYRLTQVSIYIHMLIYIKEIYI